MSVTIMRHQAMLDHVLGNVVRAALDAPQTCEVLVNPNGTIWHEQYGRDQVCIGQQAPEVTAAVIRMVAAFNGTVVHRGRPSLAGTLPGGQRFQGWVPPRTTAPAYCIRVPQAQVLTRGDYVPACCTAAVWDRMAQAIATQQTMLLVGSMSSGKTTLLNALLGLVDPRVRLVTFEDTAELVVSTPNHLQLYGTAEENLDAVVKEGFRSAGQRLPVGEIRDGKTALQALKLWLAVGGGIATVHGDSARDALTRLAYLCSEVSPGTYDYLLGGVIDLIVALANMQGHRQITEVLEVDWKEGQYVLTSFVGRAELGHRPGLSPCWTS